MRHPGCGGCGYKLGPSGPRMALLGLMRQAFLWKQEALIRELEVQYLVLGVLAGFIPKVRGPSGCAADVAIYIKMVTSGLPEKI